MKGQLGCIVQDAQVGSAPHVQNGRTLNPNNRTRAPLNAHFDPGMLRTWGNGYGTENWRPLWAAGPGPELPPY